MTLGTVEHKPLVSLHQAYVEISFCVFFWGASFASMKIAVGETAPILAVWFRIAFGMLVLLPFAVWRKELAPLPRKDWLALAVLGFQGVVFHQNVQFVGMASAGVANANWMIAGTPSVVALLGWLFLGETLSKGSVAGLLISGFGVLLVVGLGTKGLGLFRIGALGDLMITVSAVNWAVFQILSRRLVRASRPTFTVFWMNVFALAMQSVLLLVFPSGISELASISPRGWSAMLFLGCICSGLCYIFWYDGLSVMPAARVAAFQFIQPLFGVLAAYFITGERFTPFILFGGTLTLCGIWMVNHGKRTNIKGE